MQYRVQEAQEEQDQPQVPGYRPSQAPGQGVNHNTAAVKMAGKGLKDQEVTYVPLTSFMGLVGPDGEYTKSG